MKADPCHSAVGLEPDTAHNDGPAATFAASASALRRFGATGRGYGGQESRTLRTANYQRGSDLRRLESPPPKPPLDAGFGRASLTVRLRPPI